MVWIFKTSVKNNNDIQNVKPVLDQMLLPDAFWNFDLEDCDNILRIEGEVIKPRRVELLLNEAGYACEELVDKLTTTFQVFPVYSSFLW